ncbi:MAG TPA: DUF2283 domain-containing protein [bacterium]|nr:DUF2283 domain-containing protein [bacterium]
MKLSYDPKLNVAYIKFQDRRATVQSLRLSDELILDISADGKIYGLELLNASEQLQTEDGYLHLFNEFTGQKAELALTE